MRFFSLRLRLLATSRAFSTSLRPLSAAPPFKNAPSPPRLPKEEQEIFERLQKESTGAFSTPKPAQESSNASFQARINQSPDSRMQINQSPDSSDSEGVDVRLEGQVVAGEEVHPNIRRGAPPEFEGDVNPKTGEVGGPKNEPLRWGGAGDWSYNGRVTDF
ncbi:DUF1674-domain-containing protein [Lepidopterella palustris CBS 459.81]|uniref:Succinate dehydrogenase assembly factor 4, mitochondrial n=1 Tax=Lepidopterella palustris CBS 459.81 TaxID=1314670 RepID=A0A8E2JKV7_9PEZI|nr:DUF1674-domain-containing protein [Lepidopterella palustris CBS 459.81]